MAKLDRLFGRLPSGALLSAERVYGRALRVLGDHPIGHQVIAESHRQMGRAIAAFARATKLTSDVNAVEAAKKTMEKFFSPLLDVVAESEDAFTFTFSRCPYSLENGETPLCHAIMNLEEELVRELGGSLEIEKRIADGDGHCRFTVRLQR